MDSHISNDRASDNVSGHRLDTKKNQFNIDKQEYMQVFKIFDGKNEGVINIDDVYEMINKFESGAPNSIVGQSQGQSE
jgi:Ca2+-binding EF-hand superfamily protein